MSEDILLGILTRLLGFPQAPDSPLSRPVEHAFRRGFLAPVHPHGFISARSGFLFIPYRAVENQKIHPVLIGLPVLQIAVNVEVSKAKTSEMFFKYANLLC